MHAADLHLDTPFSGVQAGAPFVATALRDASLHAYEAIIRIALEREVEFVLFAGDIYDGSERGVRAQIEFLDGLRRLNDAGIQSFIVHGNHDPLDTGWSAIASSWPELVTIFPALGSDQQAPEVISVVRDGVQIATVQGVSFKERATTANLAKNYHRPEGSGIHIGLLHCNVEGSPSVHSNYSPCSVKDLIDTGLDYLALGHVHDRRILSGAIAPGDPWIVYPGNTQARSVNETGAKGIYIVNVTDNIINDPEFVACDEIRFFQREVVIDECETIIDLVDHLHVLEQETLGFAEGRSIIMRVILVGRGDLHADLVHRDALEEILASLHSRSARSVPFCWWEQLIDRTQPAVDFNEIRTRGDFAADVLRLADEYLHDNVARKAILEQMAAIIPKNLKREFSARMAEPGFAKDLVAKARLRALDEILGD